MKVAVMTTGPGVIRPIATASMNWRLVSQWCWATTPSRRNGTMARPLPKMNAPALRKNKPRETRTPADAVRVIEGDHEQAGGDEQDRDLRAGHRGDDGEDRADDPQPGVAAVGEPGEFPGGDGDDGHDGGGDAVEQRLHDRQPGIPGVDDGDG